MEKYWQENSVPCSGKIRFHNVPYIIVAQKELNTSTVANDFLNNEGHE